MNKIEEGLNRLQLEFSLLFCIFEIIYGTQETYLFITK